MELSQAERIRSAIQLNDFDTATTLLGSAVSQGYDINSPLPTHNYCSDTLWNATFWASLCPDTKILEHLVSIYSVDVNLKDASGYTPLLIAAYHCKEHNVRVLVRAQADLNASSNFSESLEDLVLKKPANSDSEVALRDYVEVLLGRHTMEWINAADSAGKFWDIEDADVGDFLNFCGEPDTTPTEEGPRDNWQVDEIWGTTSECRDERNLHRWQWTAEEDALLGKMGKKLNKDWPKIAEHFPNKSIGNIKKRFLNKHDPEVKRVGWSADEDEIIMLLFSKRGCSWTQIAEHLPGRPPDSIKNRFYGTLRKRLPHDEQVKLIRRPRAATSLLAEEATPRNSSPSPLNLDEDSLRKMTSEQKLQKIEALSVKVRSLEDNLTSAKLQIERLRATLAGS